MEDKFTYCIGFYWPNSKAIGLYTYGINHWHGTMEQAEDTLEFIRGMSDEPEKYFVCKITPVEEAK